MTEDQVPKHLITNQPPELPLERGEVGWVRLRELLISVDDVAFIPAWASVSRTEMVFGVRLEHGEDGRFRAIVPIGSRFVRTYLRPRTGDIIISKVEED